MGGGASGAASAGPMLGRCPGGGDFESLSGGVLSGGQLAALEALVARGTGFVRSESTVRGEALIRQYLPPN